MSERQEDIRLRNTQLRIEDMMRNGWGNIDPQIVERFATNTPAGVMNEWNLRPGSVLTQEQFDQIIQNLRGSGAGSSNRGYLGAMNITPEQYLADPRSPVKLENGQLVYRPEQSAQATGGEDWFGVNPTGFWNNADLVSMLPLIAVGAGPYATSMGAYGGAAATGGAGGGGSTGAVGAAGDFSLHTAGSGFGGVGSGGIGLNTAGIGLTPELIAAGGGAGAMGIGGGLGLQAINTAGTALTGATMGAGAASGGGFWETLLNTVTSSPGAAVASTLSTFLEGGGSLLEWLQSKENADALEKSLREATERGDPFAGERPFYQNMLRDSYTNPDFWKNNAVFKGISDVASSDAQRQAAARGFNNSSNVLYDVADRIQKTGMNYATNFQGQLAQNAGAGISPGTSANIAAQGANQVMGANQQSNGALGNFVSNIPGMVNSIKGLVTQP